MKRSFVTKQLIRNKLLFDAPFHKPIIGFAVTEFEYEELKREKLKRTLKITFIAVFLVFWTLGMFSSRSAGACLDEGKEISARLRFCNWASSTTIAKYFEADHNEFTSIELERAIVLAQAGREDESLAVMTELFEWASFDPTKRKAVWSFRDGRDDKVAHVIFSRTDALDKDSAAYRVFQQALASR